MPHCISSMFHNFVSFFAFCLLVLLASCHICFAKWSFLFAPWLYTACSALPCVLLYVPLSALVNYFYVIHFSCSMLSLASPCFFSSLHFLECTIYSATFFLTPFSCSLLCSFSALFMLAPCPFIIYFWIPHSIPATMQLIPLFFAPFFFLPSCSILLSRWNLLFGHFSFA